MLKIIRRILAVLCFVAVTLLFLDFTGTLHHWLGWTAKAQFFPAVLAANFIVIGVLVVLTLIFGRIYCSVVCPLGVMQDLVSWLHGRFKKNRFTYSKEVKWLRYPLLIIFIALMVAGVGAVLTLLEPYGTYGMIATNLFQPVYEWFNNLFASIAERSESYTFYSVDVWVKSMLALALSIGFFVIIAVLAWRGGRTYCNTICPVGTLLSFLSRFSFLKVHIDDSKCIKCGMCTRNCKSSCVNHEDGSVDHSRCVVCGNCLTKCKKDAIYYGRPRKTSGEVKARNVLKAVARDTIKVSPPSLEPKPVLTVESAGNVTSPKKHKESIDKGKRAFLIGSGAAVATIALAQAKKKVDGGLAAIEEKDMPKRKNPITPPGSVSARNMARHCTACQLCVAECPNHVLVPSSDILTLMQPTMTYERGYCRPECIRCSKVCPTGAIKPITFEEKSSIQIGYAVWDQSLCIPTREKDKNGNPISCGNCADHCPTKAITMLPLDENDADSPLVPKSINRDKCIGCGNCEYVCPGLPPDRSVNASRKPHARTKDKLVGIREDKSSVDWVGSPRLVEFFAPAGHLGRPVAAIHVEGYEDHRMR